MVCSLVLLHYTSICFHLVRCFYRLTDWTGLLFFFFFFQAPTECKRNRPWTLRATRGQNYTSCFWNERAKTARNQPRENISLSFIRHKKGNEIRHCGKLNQIVSAVQRRNKQTLPSLVWNSPKDGLDLTRSSLVLFGFAYLCVCLLPIWSCPFWK